MSTKPGRAATATGGLWTFKTEDAILYKISTSRGSEVIEAVLGEDFDGTFVNDGWTAYPAFTDAFQWCWAHLVREPDDLAERHSEADRIASMLHRLYDWLHEFLETDPADEACARMREHASRTSRISSTWTPIMNGGEVGKDSNSMFADRMVRQ